VLKVHCLLNCFAAMLEGRHDYRPLFFGEWDSPLTRSGAGEISYFSAEIGHDTYLERFRYLYGDAITEWYSYTQSKERNYQQLCAMLNETPMRSPVIVQVDLYYLPYDKRLYRRAHRPHYIFLRSEEGSLYIDDPYLGWQGAVDEQVVKSAFIENALGGGFALHPERVQAPVPERVSRLFETVFHQGENDLVMNCRGVLDEIQQSQNGMGLQQLSTSFSQIGVIAQRKLSYTYAFHYFGQADPALFEQRVDQLVKMWKSLAFLAIRVSMSNDEKQLRRLEDKLNAAEELERMIKAELWDNYQTWRVENG
jgi:hypothetical protein